MKNNSRKSEWRSKIWQSNIITLILIVLLVFSFIKVSKEVLLRYEINKEISELDNKLQSLEEKTKKTNNLIAYLQTDEYIEEEARLKLNLSKPGEKQINLTAQPSSSMEIEESDNRTNISKWFNYFFEKYE